MRLSTNALPHFYSTAGRESSRSKEIQRVFIKPLKLGCAASVGAVCSNKLHSLELPLTWWWSQEQEGRAGDQRKKSIDCISCNDQGKHTILVLQKPTFLPQWAQSEGEEEAMKGEKVGLVQEKSLFVGSGGTAESVLHGPHSALVSSEPCGAQRGSQESSDLLSAMASSRSSCSCWVSLASRSFSSRSLSRFAHSIMSSSVGYCPNTQTHITHFRSVARNKSGTKTHLNPVNCFSVTFPTGCLK